VYDIVKLRMKIVPIAAFSLQGINFMDFFQKRSRNTDRLSNHNISLIKEVYL